MSATGRGAPAQSATADREIVISRVISARRERQGCPLAPADVVVIIVPEQSGAVGARYGSRPAVCAMIVRYGSGKSLAASRKRRRSAARMAGSMTVVTGISMRVFAGSRSQ
jgi:hypothetical protein